MPGLIVFDVDGTILDSQTMYDSAVLEYSAAQNAAPNLRPSATCSRLPLLRGWLGRDREDRLNI